MSILIYVDYYKYIGEGPEGAWMIRVGFDDIGAISDWALEAVAYCSIKGVILGKPGNFFDPKGYATRAEFATMLVRLIATEETE